MSITGFNRRRRELAAQQGAARLKAQQKIPIKTVDDMTYQELRALAKERQIEDYYKMDTDELKTVLSGGEINVGE